MQIIITIIIIIIIIIIIVPPSWVSPTPTLKECWLRWPLEQQISKKENDRTNEQTETSVAT